MLVTEIAEMGGGSEPPGHRHLVDLIRRFTSAPENPAVQARLLDLLLDGIGVGLAGRSTRVGGVANQFGAGGRPWDRALAQGMRMHALDFDDTHEPSLCHTGAAVLPGLLALGASESRSGAQFRDGLNLGLRLIDFLAPYGPLLNEMGVHSTGILGSLGAAAACAWLISGDSELTAGAVETAALMSAGLAAAFGTDGKPVQAGRAAEVGVRSALLTSAGLSTPQSAIFGPRSLFSLWLRSDLPALDWESDHGDAALKVALKPYPACFLTHGVIDDFLQLRDSLDLTDPAAVQRIQVTVHPIAQALADKTDLTASNDGKFSLRYCALAALTEGEVVLGTFDGATRQRLFRSAGGWQSWVDSFDVTTDRSLPVVAASVRVRTRDGRSGSTETRAQRGGLANPLTRRDIVAKFRANSGALPAVAAARVLEQVWSLPETSSLRCLDAITAAAGVAPDSAPVA